APSDAVALSHGHGALGLPRPPSPALSPGNGPGRAVPGRARTKARRLPLFAPGRRLDRLSRHAGTGRAQLPSALGPAPAMSREQILGNIRRALHRAAPPETAPLEARLREPPTG